MDIESAPDNAVRKRVSTACEACRATKIKCQPSDQPGVCQKCLESKKECVSRTGPRTRRRRAQLIQDNFQPPAAATPSSTFSIDFAVPAQPEVDEDFESLREAHAGLMDNLFPPESVFDDFTMSGFPTPPASSSQSHSIQDLHAKPQFNLASAESLLESFRGMLSHFPCIVLPPDATVPHLAATQPFVLLAILASASGSKTLQGHSLYDEEFRKVLGLKFVAGGERSLELLQGLLIYCAWYPFHLRPKNKQAYQYLRMSADLVTDLELDQDFRVGFAGNALGTTDQQLDNIRAYLAYDYIVSAFMATWRKYKTLTPTFTPWTAACCDILEQNAQVGDDAVLVHMVRLANTANDAYHAVNEPSGQTEQQRRLLLLGLDAQLQNIQGTMPPRIASTTSMKLATMFVAFYLESGTLLKIPRPLHRHGSSLPLLASKLHLCVGHLKEFLTYVVSLDQTDFLSFTGVEWARLVLAIILAIRLSFPPVLECPEWDTAWARSQLNFSEFLNHMCREIDLTPSSKKVDVLSASRVIIRMVKEKYDRRLALLNTQAETPTRGTCPMLDGSLEQYFPFWDAGIGVNSPGQAMGQVMGQVTGQSGTAAQPVFHDLWATMTMSWAEEDQGIP